MNLLCFLIVATAAVASSIKIGQFLKTITYFNGLPNPLAPLQLLFGKRRSKDMSGAVRANDLLWSGENNVYGLGFGSLDDVVMGGRSESSWNEGKWAGRVTTENNGGFAGVRSRNFLVDASGVQGISISLLGDGNTFKFICRDSEDFNGIAWSSSFDTVKDRAMDVRVKFSELIPTKFARTVQGAAPFNKKTLRAIQFSLSKFEYDGGLNSKFTEGPFKLDVKSISFF